MGEQVGRGIWRIVLLWEGLDSRRMGGFELNVRDPLLKVNIARESKRYCECCNGSLRLAVLSFFAHFP